MVNSESERCQNALRLLDSHKKTIGEKTFTSPNPDHYPHAFLWDSCFHAIVMARSGDLLGAEREVKTIFSWQDKETGFISNMKFDKKRRWDPERRLTFNNNEGSNYTQPPVFAHAAWEIYTKHKDSGQQENGKRFLNEVFHDLKLGYEYFINHRENGNGSRLVGVIHPHETGRDSDPTYDKWFLQLRAKGRETSTLVSLLNSGLIYGHKLLKGLEMKRNGWDVEKIRKNIFWANDVMFNCIYAQNLAFMTDIAKALNKTRDEKFFGKKAREVKNDILNQMWDGEKKIFFAQTEEEVIDFISVSNLFPLILDEISPNQLKSCIDLLKDPDSFNTPFPIPSVPRNSPKYDPDYKQKSLWRGPVWINVNWYFAEAFANHAKRLDQVDTFLAKDCIGLAKLYRSKTYSLIDNHGYSEFYNPETGMPLRINPYGWSTLGEVTDLGEIPRARK